MTRAVKPLDDLDRAVMTHYVGGLSYKAIVIAEGIAPEQAKAIIDRLVTHGHVKGRPRGRGGHGPPLATAEAAKARRAEMMRANPNNHPANQVIENDALGRDRTKVPRLSWEEIDALYGWVTVLGQRKPGCGAKVYDEVGFR